VDKVVQALAAQHDDLSVVLQALDDVGWQTPSRCEGWTVADVVLHLAQTDELAIASVRGRYAEAVEALAGDLGPGSSVDDSAAALVARERETETGRAGAGLRERWQHSADTLASELRACDPSRRVEWVAGVLSARTLATTRLAETWIHTGDVVLPLGLELAADDRLWHIARLAWRTLPYAFAQAGRELVGPVAFALVAPNGDTWHFAPDDEAVTTVRGSALELCTVAGQRASAAETGLEGEGPDLDAVLALVRTFA
jgi:uncharacterized protein (TIGR03084 family)